MTLMRPIRLALVASLLGVPAVRAQGSAPNQGVTAPNPPPMVVDPPPTVNPNDLTSGRQRQDPGGARTSTDPSTTSGTPVPDATPAPSPPSSGQPALPTPRN